MSPEEQQVRKTGFLIEDSVLEEVRLGTTPSTLLDGSWTGAVQGRAATREVSRGTLTSISLVNETVLRKEREISFQRPHQNSVFAVAISFN